MPKPFTIDFDVLKEMFQVENPDFFLNSDVDIHDEQIKLYHTILNALKSPLAHFFDKAQSTVQNFKTYAGESSQEQSIAFIDFETPATADGQSPERHFAMLLFYLCPNPNNPKTLGLTVCFSMNGTLTKSDEPDIETEFIPHEAKCRQIIGKNINLLPVDMNFPNNVKGAICYADAIFRCFLDGTLIDFSEVQDWLSMDAYQEVGNRYASLLQRGAEELQGEITNDEDLDLSSFEGQVVFNEPALKQ